MACRISKVKYKSGTELTILPPSNISYKQIDLGWGKVSIEYYDRDEPKDMERKTALYILEAAKSKLVNG